MRVLQVVHELPAARQGGVQEYAARLAEALAGSHDVTVATARGADADLDGVEVRALPESVGWTDPTGAASGLERDVADVAVDRAVRSLLAEVEPDVVHVQHLKRTSATIPRQCAARDVPVLLSALDFWTLCHRGRLQRPDGQHCSGPESVEKCAACYADALTRAYRREWERGERERRGRADRSGRHHASADGGEASGASGGADAGEPDPEDRERDGEGDAGEGSRGHDGSTEDGSESPKDDSRSGGDAGGRSGGTGEGSGDAGGPDETDGTDGDATDAGAAADRAEADGAEAAVDEPELPTAATVRDAVERRTHRLEAARAAADLLLAPSTFVRDRLVAHGTDADRVATVEPGVRPHRYVDTGFSVEGSLAFGYAGRIAPEAGLHLLVDAFRTVTGDAELHVFGAFDPEREEYHARLRDAAGERVTFHGAPEARATPFRAADVLVEPSLAPLAHPFVVQESFAAGVPVVAGEGGATGELVEHGRDGLTYPPGDPLALARCLRALTSDPTAVRRLRAGVTPPKTLARHAREVESLYETCVDAGEPGTLDADALR